MPRLILLAGQHIQNDSDGNERWYFAGDVFDTDKPRHVEDPGKYERVADDDPRVTAGRLTNDLSRNGGLAPLDTPPTPAPPPAQAIAPPPPDPAIELTPADSPARWARMFGVHEKTFKRRCEDGTIRHRKLSRKMYHVAIADLPFQFQQQFRGPAN